MTQSRKSQISLQDTKYYHLISRCVRRAFLCGFDKTTKRSFEHRRLWMVNRIHFLSSVFAIEVASYAVMSNHYHLVVFVNEDEAKGWSNKEVCRRWGELYNLSPLVKAFLESGSHGMEGSNAAIKIINTYRERLTDLSWLMKNLNEYISRKSNKEDNCKGHFWESRFKSQALLDEKAILACMAYVDLNPIRAKMATSPNNSEFTSIFERIHSKACKRDKPEQLHFNKKPLHRFIGHEHKNSSCGLGFSLSDYLSLVDATGRSIVEGERVVIGSCEQPLLQQLGINDKDWLYLAEHFGRNHSQGVGPIKRLIEFAMHTNRKWLSGQRQQFSMFG